MTGDGSGGAFAVYEEGLGKHIYAQKISPDGNPMFEGKGVQFVGRGIGKGPFISEKAYVQRVNADGKLLWGEERIKLNP